MELRPNRTDVKRSEQELYGIKRSKPDNCLKIMPPVGIIHVQFVPFPLPDPVYESRDTYQAHSPTFQSRR